MPNYKAKRRLWRKLMERLKAAYREVEQRAQDREDISPVLRSIDKLKQQVCRHFGFAKIVAVGRRKSDGELELLALVHVGDEELTIRIAPPE